MSKRKIILWLGVLVAVLPFLGLPSSWKTVLYLVAGISIAWNSWELNKHKAMRPRRSVKKFAKMAEAESAPSAAVPFVAEISELEKKEEKVNLVS